jgi:SagB-type dehydrogenase family enzyme
VNTDIVGKDIRTSAATDVAPADTTHSTSSESTIPGTATRRYLAALRERGALDIDWSAAPTRHKRYPGAPRVPLPWPPTTPGSCDASATAAVVGALLGDLLGPARTIWYHATDDEGRPQRVQPLLLLGRPAPSGGALYPVEAYLATGTASDLPAALFHYDPVHHALERIRTGDHRPGLAESCVDLPDAVLVLTAVFGRSAFKYGDLAYRLACQETGVLLAQALAVGEGLGLSAEIRLRYDDERVDRLLGLDGEREAALAVLALRFAGRSGGSGSASRPGPPPSGPVWRANAPQPRPLPSQGAAAALHRATRRGIASAQAASRPQSADQPALGTQSVPLPTARPIRLADGVPHRASPPAGYRPGSIALPILAAVLDAAAQSSPSDVAGAARGPAATALYLLALRVEDLPTGVYRYDRERRVLVQTADDSAADSAMTAARLLPNTRTALRTAAAAVIPVGDPLAGVAAFGDRWYRLQQIETGLVAHRAALAAAASGLAARIHSDGACEGLDALLGCAGSGPISLSFLLLGTPRLGGPALARRFPRRTEGGPPAPP